MFVALDLDRCAVLPYRGDLYTVANLVHIELPSFSRVHITGLDHTAFVGVSELHMARLYKGLTGKANTIYGQRLRNVLRTMCERYAFVQHDAARADSQAEKVNSQRSERYAFNPAGPTPNKQLSDWLPVGIKIAPLADEAAASHVCPAVPPPPPPGTRVPPPPRAARAPSEPREPGAPRAPRSSGVRDTIHTVATAMWEEAGKPMDQPTILKLRKEIMLKLEAEHSVKRNTSSNELGNWQKQIICN